jgi:hypothetical protein
MPAAAEETCHAIRPDVPAWALPARPRGRLPEGGRGRRLHGCLVRRLAPDLARGGTASHRGGDVHDAVARWPAGVESGDAPSDGGREHARDARSALRGARGPRHRPGGQCRARALPGRGGRRGRRPPPLLVAHRTCARARGGLRPARPGAGRRRGRRAHPAARVSQRLPVGARPRAAWKSGGRPAVGRLRGRRRGAHVRLRRSCARARPRPRLPGNRLEPCQGSPPSPTRRTRRASPTRWSSASR